MKYTRRLDIKAALQKKSHFLFGPRSVGKTTLVKTQLGDEALYIDLLRSAYVTRLRVQPDLLESMVLESKKNLIVIDEIQKIPALLNEVHRLIEERRWTFLLTGSSARRLKSDNSDVNLLGGRAWKCTLFPLVSTELPSFDLSRYLHIGGLPHVNQSEYPIEELYEYVESYLRDEIIGEGIIRDLPRFSKLLKIAALSTGEIINFSKVASDIGCAPTTAIEHFRILQDTLIGWLLEPWGQSKKRKEVTQAKFYLFDTGITNVLSDRPHAVSLNSSDFGKLLEQFLANELRAYLTYNKIRLPLTFWRTYDQKEVDFVIGSHLAIEVKSTQKSDFRDAKGLKYLEQEQHIPVKVVVSLDVIDRHEEGIDYLHIETFLRKLWNHQLFSPDVSGAKDF